jgi:ssDNA-binding Zn-finger/Zn-ribbon topoisomerase 1
MTETITKACPECGKDLEVQVQLQDPMDEFLGCSQWPKCKYTEPLPVDIQLRRKGVVQLPGF